MNQPNYNKHCRFQMRRSYKGIPNKRGILGREKQARVEALTGFALLQARSSMVDGWCWCWFEEEYEEGSGGPPMVNLDSGEVRFR